MFLSLVSPTQLRIFSISGYFAHPMLEKRIERLVKEQIETINSDIKVISDEIFQR
jgi:hypothetical protein